MGGSCSSYYSRGDGYSTTGTTSSYYASELVPNQGWIDTSIIRLKTVIVGDSGVGKSSIINRYTEDAYSDAPNSTIGIDFRSKNVMLKNAVGERTVKLLIWDTSGQERFKSITQSYYKNAACVLLAYDITSRITFDSITNVWMKEVERYSSPLTVILVGSKKDEEEKREVPVQEARNLARTLGYKFIEVSAKTGEGIPQLFGIVTATAGEKAT